MEYNICWRFHRPKNGQKGLKIVILDIFALSSAFLELKMKYYSPVSYTLILRYRELVRGPIKWAQIFQNKVCKKILDHAQKCIIRDGLFWGCSRKGGRGSKKGKSNFSDMQGIKHLGNLVGFQNSKLVWRPPKWLKMTKKCQF